MSQSTFSIVGLPNLEQLTQLGVVDISATYYGGHDEGAIDVVEANVELPEELSRLVEDWIYEKVVQPEWGGFAGEFQVGGTVSLSLETMTGRHSFDYETTPLSDE